MFASSSHAVPALDGLGGPPIRNADKQTRNRQMNHGHLITVTTVSASDHARHPKENRNPPNGKATMFHKPRLRQKAVCRQGKLRRGCYPQKHTRTSRKHDYTDATRRCHNLSCDRRVIASEPQRRTHATVYAYESNPSHKKQCIIL